MSFAFVIFLACALSYSNVGGSRSFKTKYGDVYDCVEFYKQPSFRHPALKYHNFYPTMRPSFLTRDVEGNITAKKTKLNKEGCSLGTIPIRRITKDSSKIGSYISVNEPSGTYDAGVRTKRRSTKYNGGSMIVSVYNPRTMPSAYSEARIKISSGIDAIQVGWRVDPALRGDNLTRLFIYTETRSSRCFDAQCGFIHVNKEFLLDDYISHVSQPGGTRYSYKFNIVRDPTSGNWWLVCTSSKIEVGFWPKSIFTGLGDLATDVDWAGEVYSPPGIPEPLMGSGYRPSVGTTAYVAYFRMIKVINENSTYVEIDNLEEFATDRSLYDVEDEGNVGGYYGHLIFFGGARY